MPHMSAYEYLYRTNCENPNDIALIYFDVRTSYAQLFRQIEEFAGCLLKYGVKPGEVVTICMPNTPEAIIAFYAVNRIGAVADMLHPLSAGKEIQHSLQVTGSQVLILIDMDFMKVKPFLGETQVRCTIISSASLGMPLHLKMMYHLAQERKYRFQRKGTPGFVFWTDFLQRYRNSDPTFTPGNLEAVAVLFHTGGTTGTPKAAMITNDNFNGSITQIQIDNDIVTRGEKLIAVMPIFHGFGSSNCVHLALCSGVCAVLMPKFSPRLFERTVMKHKINHILGVPTIFEAMLKHDMFRGKDLSFFRYLIAGGDKLQETVEEKFQTYLKAHHAHEPLLKAYGLTEAVAATTRTRRNINPPDSVGIPFIKNTYKVVSVENGKELPYNQIGELWISGPSVMKGYYGDEEATSQVLTVDPDGTRWLHTGDMGYIDEDGMIYFAHRNKRIIISNGYNIYPSEIEKLLASHPAVMKCITVGVPDVRKTEVPVCFVILKKGCSREDVVDELKQMCAHHLSRYAIPAEILLRDHFPTTLMNKTDYRKLAEEYMASKRVNG